MSPTEPTSNGKPLDPSRAKKIMQDTLGLFKKMGLGAIDLLKRLKKDKSPQAMLKTLGDSIAANQQRREGLSTRLEQQFKQIAAKKKAYETAPPARKRILEAELKSMLATYQAAERELNVLLENERTLAQVQGRLHEITAYGMAGVTEVSIDNLIDDLEDKVSEAEGRSDAARDLEKAGKRRERESDREGFLDQLAGFDEAEPASALAGELAGFEEPGERPAREKPAKSTAAPQKNEEDADHER